MTAVSGPLANRPLMSLRRILPGNRVGTKVTIPKDLSESKQELQSEPQLKSKEAEAELNQEAEVDSLLPREDQMGWCCSLFDDAEELIYAPLSRRVAKRCAMVTI